MILIKTTTIAMISRIWMKPPIVYPLTNPRSHIIMRITKIVQSILPSFPVWKINHPVNSSWFKSPLLKHYHALTKNQTDSFSVTTEIIS